MKKKKVALDKKLGMSKEVVSELQGKRHKVLGGATIANTVVTDPNPNCICCAPQTLPTCGIG